MAIAEPITPEQAAEELLRRRKAADSLHEYMRQAWPQVESGRPFKDNWHIGAIAEHLEAVTTGQIRNLLINQPPRTTKSLTVAVFWPSWVWIKHPEIQWLFASYSHTLSLRDSRRCRSLIKSGWYQARWGNRYSISDVSDTLLRYDNDKSGYRVSTSVDGTNTGEGGDILVFDDLNNVRDQSDTVLQSTLDWWTDVMPTRMNDFKTSRRVCVQQRTHEKDISGHIIANDTDHDWVRLILPMEHEVARTCVTVALPTTQGRRWRDPRKKDGDLLDPNRIGPVELKRLKRELGSQYTIAGQLQQRPAPEEGGMIKKGWFKLWKSAEPPKLDYTVLSVDTAMSEQKDAAYSAAITLGVFKDEHAIPNVILLSTWRERCEYPELRDRLKRLSYDYLDDKPGERPTRSTARKPDLILIEKKANGISLIQDLRHGGIVAHGFTPDKMGDKKQRVRIITPFLESGRMWVPAAAPDFKRARPFAEEFVLQCASFPNAESRDLVDTLTQALWRLISSGFVWVGGDDGPADPVDTSQREAFY